MNDITTKLQDILENYGYQNSNLFQQKFDEFLTSVKSIIDRQTAYNLVMAISNNNLSIENSDYLADIVADIRGHSAEIYYKFKDDPNINDEKLQEYVRKNLWNNSPYYS